MEKFEVGRTYYGFKVKNKEFINDLDSEAYLFEHEKSKARLIYLKNDDENKVFFITFKTPPKDDCGTAHILEHSVLCGSKKYKLKDPFVELAKGSLNTFLNAMTFGDKTMYPIASKNHKDFNNLMSVYLDAVFNPLIYERKEIFMQEGWHIEVEKGALNFNGVVYNEMKGALSDPEVILNNEVEKSLFSTSVYKYESGGDPLEIVNLTYEDFLDFHKKYYHPSNSYIYLYGDLDINERLKYLNEEYLSNYSYEKIESDIEIEKDYKPKNTVDSFYFTKEKSGTYFSYNFVTGLSTDAKLIMAMSILGYILLETNSSPLKKAIIESKIAEDIESWYDSSNYEPVFMIVAKNADKTKKEEFKKIIDEELEKIYKNGIDKEIVNSSLNIIEFSMREEDFGYKPRGLFYGIKLMKSWLHEENPFDSLKIFELISEIRKESENGYFEKLIKDYFIDNKHTSFVSLNPTDNQDYDFYNKTKELLKVRRESMTEKELQKVIDETKNLLEYQEEPEKQEDLESIPLLNLSEIDKKAEIIENHIVKSNILFTPLKTNGIIYIKFLFDTRNIPQNFIPYIGLFSDLVGKIDTKNYSFEKLPLYINMNSGGILLKNDVYSKNKDDYKSYLSVNAKFLSRNIKEVFNIFNEIIFNSYFDNKENIEKIIKAEKLRLENYISNNLHVTAKLRCISHYSSAEKYKDIVDGVEYLRFLNNLDLKSNFDVLKENLNFIAKQLFNKENLFVSVACTNEDSKLCLDYIKEFIDKLDEKNFEKVNYNFDFSIKKEAIITLGNVLYNSKAANYFNLGYKYSGKMRVLKMIVDLEYLWNKIRVQGGAYGCGCNFTKNGDIYTYSYRDPNIEYTLESYNKIGEFLNKFNANNREMTKFIIGAVNEKPYTNNEKSEISLARYICDIKNEDVQRERDEILSTTLEDLKSFENLFNLAMNENNICVVGNRNKIEDTKTIFDKVSPLI